MSKRRSRSVVVSIALAGGLAGFAPGAVAEESTDAAGTTETAPAQERLPRIDELVPGLTTEVPTVEELTPSPEQAYPNAGDILRAMRELPPLERGTAPVAPPPEEGTPEATGEATADASTQKP